jgi:hypothetical protein
MNIFYTQVDTNLQLELNARASSSFSRDTASLNYMLSKIANVEIRAFDGPGPIIDENDAIHVLGGQNIWNSDYTAGGLYGFLNEDKTVIRPNPEDPRITWDYNPKTKQAHAKRNEIDAKNPQLRIPPYISSADIQIGDNSMGLMNTANVVIEIPNAERDLNLMEEIYMRPGRYVKLLFINDASSLVSTSTTSGLLSGSIPADAKLKELYPGVDLETKKTEIRRMNQIMFEGLITNFNFSYQKDFSVQLQISLRGTSNVFTDVSMFIDTQGNTPSKVTADPIANPDEYKATITQTTGSSGTRTSFFEQLYTEVETLYENSFKQKNQQSFITKIKDNQNNKTTTPIKVKYQLNRLDKPANTKHTDHYFLFGNAWAQETEENKTSSNTVSTFQRYITLGYLVDFINRTVISKQTSQELNERLKGNTKFVASKYPEIIHSDTFCFSNYYADLCSIDPQNILLLPADNKRGTSEFYGYATQTQEKKIFFKDTLSVDGTWQGFSGNASNKIDRTYPSRIMINLELIDDIIVSLGSEFKVSDFLAQVSSYVSNATSGAVSLKLITHPENQNVLAWYDEKYLGTPDDKKGVQPYTMPMTSGYSVVSDFQLKAQLPDNVSSLSYVLNQNPENISSEDIAPYINYMYNSNDPAKVTAAQQLQADTYYKYLTQLQTAKRKYSESFTDRQLADALDKAQKVYLQYPSPDIKESIQQIAPIIPFEISFTIDGIHGFRYGDVLTFDVLPEKYKINTVFSIVAVNHQVSQEGTWSTEIRCIMRPKVNG